MELLTNKQAEAVLKEAFESVGVDHVAAMSHPFIQPQEFSDIASHIWRAATAAAKEDCKQSVSILPRSLAGDWLEASQSMDDLIDECMASNPIDFQKLALLALDALRLEKCRLDYVYSQIDK